jgi:hypothetical protein
VGSIFQIRFFPVGGTMNKKTNITKEYNRLKSLFQNSDETKKKMVDELFKKAAFLKVNMDELQGKIAEEGITIVNNKGVPSINPSYKAYLQSVSAYQGIIKTLNTIFGKQIEDEEDEFESFMAKNGKS